MLLNPITITTEEELGAILAHCGFASTSASNTPEWIWVPWTREWKGRAFPLSQALSNQAYEGFIVAFHKGVFQVYELDQLNGWYHLVGETTGAVSGQELTRFLQIATTNTPFLERRRLLRENTHF